MSYTRSEEKVFIGYKDGERIWLTFPTWDCKWYWSFGYLGNINCHFHLNGIDEDKNLYDAIKEGFDEVKNEYFGTWEFCELVETIYQLKKTAKMYHMGGSNYTTNPFKGDIQSKVKEDEINEVILPKLFKYLEDKLLNKTP